MKQVRRKIQKLTKFKNKIDHLYYKTVPNICYICAAENGKMTSKHIETIRILVTRRIKKIGGQLVIKVKPYIPITKKSLGVRMGKGKGSFQELIFYTKTDQVLFELRNIPQDLSLTLYKKINYKSPVKLKILNYNK